MGAVTKQDLEVLHLSKYYFPYNGGLEEVVKDIGQGVLPYRAVSVLAAYEGKHVVEELLEGVMVIRVPIWRRVGSAYLSGRYLQETIRRIAGKLVHVHLPNPMSNFGIILAAMLGKKPAAIVVHWHSDIVKQQKTLFFYKPFHNWLLKRADTVVVTSDAYLRNSAQLSAFHHKCVVIPIGIKSLGSKVDYTRVKAIRTAYGSKKIVFSLGRHIYYKGFEYLIEAFKHVDHAVLLLGGVGPDTKLYVKLAEELGITDRVVFLGRVDECDLASMYAAADCFCLPSIEKSEAFGVVQLEAMSVGTPVVSTNIKGSGVPWVNEHMVSGLVCEPKSVEELSRALNHVLANSAERERLSVGAKRRFEEYFERETMVEAIETLYRKVLQTN